MAVSENLEMQDPLGLQTFALSESAYDLIVSLIGVYTRMVELACKEESPKVEQLSKWNNRIDELHALYYQSEWDDLGELPALIVILTDEYRQIAHLETQFVNAANTDTRAVLSY